MTSPADRNGVQLTRVWAMGPVSPPVTGMTLLTEKVLERLQQAGPVTFWNWSHGYQMVTARAHALRVCKTLACAIRLLRNGHVTNGRLYLVANSRAGLLLTCLLVYVGKRMGHRVSLHHHTYGYINAYNRRMAWIDRRLDKGDTHVVHCRQMIDDFRRVYPTRCRFETIFPSVVSLAIGQPRSSAGSPFRLGILSNLIVDKGLDLAIDAFRALLSEGRQVRLILAGPIRSHAAQTMIDAALAAHPDAIEYVGAVYGDAKAHFFAHIDALLFPTRYNEESWGIVLNEAFAAGAPVITFDRGCTRTVVGVRAGLVVPRDGDFATAAAKQIGQWIDDPAAYRESSEAAIEQAEYLQREGKVQLDQFAERMFTPIADLSAHNSSLS